MLPRTLVLETPRLVLRPFEEDDFEQAYEMFTSPKVNATYMLPDYPDRESAKKTFDLFFSLSRREDRIVYAVSLNGLLIGFLNDCGIEGESVELGYVIHPDHWRCGYATEALTAVIAELFRMGFSRVQAAHAVQNPASGRVMQKSGMIKTGKTETIEYRGAEHLCLYYEITNETK